MWCLWGEENCRFAIDINDIYYYTEYMFEKNNEERANGNIHNYK